MLYKARLGDLRVPCQKTYNATAGYYRKQLTSAGQLGKWDGFFERSEDAVPLTASSDKVRRAEAKAQMQAPSCEISATVV